MYFTAGFFLMNKAPLQNVAEGGIY